MTRHGRALCSLHGLLGIWLAYCAVQSGRNGVAWAVIVFAAASLVPVISVIRESELADQQRGVAVRAEREARVQAWVDEDAAAVARVELAAACCDIWWTSAGADHEATCPKRDHWSPA